MKAVLNEGSPGGRKWTASVKQVDYEWSTDSQSGQRTGKISLCSAAYT